VQKNGLGGKGWADAIKFTYQVKGESFEGFGDQLKWINENEWDVGRVILPFEDKFAASDYSHDGVWKFTKKNS